MKKQLDKDMEHFAKSHSQLPLEKITGILQVPALPEGLALHFFLISAHLSPLELN